MKKLRRLFFSIMLMFVLLSQVGHPMMADADEGFTFTGVFTGQSGGPFPSLVNQTFEGQLLGFANVFDNGSTSPGPGGGTQTVYNSNVGSMNLFVPALHLAYMGIGDTVGSSIFVGDNIIPNPPTPQDIFGYDSRNNHIIGGGIVVPPNELRDVHLDLRQFGGGVGVGPPTALTLSHPLSSVLGQIVSDVREKGSVAAVFPDTNVLNITLLVPPDGGGPVPVSIGGHLTAITPIPEPSTLLLLGSGLAGAVMWRMWKSSAS